MSKQGIALLLTVVLLSAILSIGIGIFNLMFGQIFISGEIGDSSRAFFAADEAVERTLYRDRKMTGEICRDAIGPNCHTEGITNVTSGACYTLNVSKLDEDADGNLETDIIAVGQYRCGSNPLRFVKRAYEAFYEPLPQCSDGIDNDGDTFIDFPDDPQCVSSSDNDEAS